MDREARREYLESLLADLRDQRKVDPDQLLMELLHFVFELDDEARELAAKVEALKPG
jgi:hypothetical protein